MQLQRKKRLLGFRLRESSKKYIAVVEQLKKDVLAATMKAGELIGTLMASSEHAGKEGEKLKM